MQIVDVISPELFSYVCGGKYSGWAKHLTIESLETLLSAIGVFGREYNCVISNYPDRVLCADPVERMKFAIGFIAALQGHRDTERDYERDCFCIVSNEPGSAFTEVFKNQICTNDHFASWAVNLSEKQLKMLLWQVGEYAIRVSSDGFEDGGSSLPLFVDVPLNFKVEMQNTLAIIVAIHNGHKQNNKLDRHQVAEVGI